MSALLLLAALAAGAPACHAEANGAYVEPWDPEVTQCFHAPSGSMMVQAKGARLELHRRDARYPLGQVDGGHVYWNPAATGVAFTDNEGSGQSSYLYFVDARAKTPARSSAMGDAAVSLFKRRFHCTGTNTYVYVWIDGWNADGRLRLVVQEGPHSEGCRTYGNTVGMLVEPERARVIKVLGDDEMRRAWCTRQERLEFGYCYDEALVASFKRPKK